MAFLFALSIGIYVGTAIYFIAVALTDRPALDAAMAEIARRGVLATLVGIGLVAAAWLTGQPIGLALVVMLGLTAGIMALGLARRVRFRAVAVFPALLAGLAVIYLILGTAR